MKSNITHSEEIARKNIIEEGVFEKLPRLAAAGGLAAALAFGGSSAQAKQPVKVSNVRYSASGVPVSQSQTNAVANVTTNSMFDFISKWEGSRAKVYKDHVGNPTIGIGHYLNDSESDRNLITSLFSGKVNYDDLLSGKQQLKNDQIEKLFNVDVKIKEKLASKLIPDYETFDQGTKNAIVNALYRGDLGKKTIALINKKDWKAAAIQYLNHKNVKSGPEQVKRRMKTNAALLYKNAQKTPS